MQDDNQLEDSIRSTVMEVCAVLYTHGITRVPIGTMMRLLGVDASIAARHDDEWFKLDDEFAALYAQYNKSQTLNIGVPPGSTLH